MVFNMSNLNNEIIYEGWLTKSPPTKRLWKARWRRRWFVLKHSGELPGQYYLLYYTDKNCRKLKGTIDLDQCEQVDCGLRFQNSKQNYSHMFDVKTAKRTYYLAAESEHDMNKWVDSICQVCALRATVDDTSVEIVEEPNDSLSGELEAIDQRGQKIVKKAEPSFERSYSVSIYDAHQSPSTPQAYPNTGAYISISDCHSGKPLNTPKGISDFNNIISRQEVPNFKYPGKDVYAFKTNITRPGVKQTICADDISKSDVNKPIALPIAVQTAKPPVYERHNLLYESRQGREEKITNIESAKKMAEMRKEAVSDEFYDSPRKVVADDETAVPSVSAKAPPPNWDTFPGDDFTPGAIGSWRVEEQFGKWTVIDSKQPMATKSLNRAHKQQIRQPDTFSLRKRVAPPRPPKPLHFVIPEQKSEDQDLESPKCAESLQFESGEESASPTVAAISEDTYDIPRSHQPPESDTSQNKDAYANAMPVKGLQGTVFRYDFTETGLANPSASGEPLSPRFFTNNSPSSLDVPTPPAVNRELKPMRKISDSGASSEPSPGPYTPSLGQITPSYSGGEPSPVGFGPPSIDRTLKPKKLSSDGSFKLSRAPDGDLVMRRVRTGPSQTPPNALNHQSRTWSDNNGIDDSDQALYSTMDNITYLDLDLDSDAPGQSPGNGNGSPGPASTPYKEIDFLKTKAFNMTREEVDKKRKGGKNTD